jgi:hypothetical protein
MLIKLSSGEKRSGRWLSALAESSSTPSLIISFAKLFEVVECEMEVMLKKSYIYRF